MDFLDPKKQRAHRLRLLVGYVLVGLALAMATIILVYQAYGFGIDKNGKVIQNGLVFMSSVPGPAQITINGKMEGQQTNTRLTLPAGQYTFQLTRDGYRTWRRAITVEGGSVGRFDYPLLIPTKLTSTAIKKYATAPTAVLQSPDKRWLLVQSGADGKNFDLFDLKNPQSEPKALQLPAAALTAADGAQSWELVSWANDNRHVLLGHHYMKTGQAATEYVLLDRQDPLSSLNLTNTLGGAAPTEIVFRAGAYDQYYLYDQPAATLRQASLKNPTPAPYVDHVLAYKAFDKDTVLYATDSDAPAGKAMIKLRQGNKVYLIRSVALSAQYLLNLGRYSGDWYVAVGTPDENKVYVYKNPQAVLNDQPTQVLTPVSILKVPGANYLSFASGFRFVMAENGQHFALYDFENKKSYNYTVAKPLDEPQLHASWIDGFHLMFVSGGRTLLLDFDSVNQQTLSAANPMLAPALDSRSHVLYAFAAQTDASGAVQQTLQSTPLRTKADQ